MRRVKGEGSTQGRVATSPASSLESPSESLAGQPEASLRVVNLRQPQSAAWLPCVWVWLWVNNFKANLNFFKFTASGILVVSA